MLTDHLVHAFTQAALSPDPDLAVPALMFARVEYPALDAGPYLDRLDAIGREARRRVEAARVAPGEAGPRVDPERHAHVMALNGYLFGELGFAGNERQYDDPRNSFLNEVIDRRTGIPIALAVLYIEVARRAGVAIEGINFPGHFLLRCRPRRGMPYTEDLIIDAFHQGALLSEDACASLLQRHAGEDTELHEYLRGHATKPQILGRMLLNLKRLYVRMHSFPQARDVTRLLMTVNPSALSELRDRGLLAFHLKDFSGALRDLQQYLRLSANLPLDDGERESHAEIWEHVKTLRRRVASLN